MHSYVLLCTPMYSYSYVLRTYDGWLCPYTCALAFRLSDAPMQLYIPASLLRTLSAWPVPGVATRSMYMYTRAACTR
jgi:hypothetical protein